MARLFSNRDRPFDLGELPTELLARAVVEPVAGVRQPADAALKSSAPSPNTKKSQAEVDGPLFPATA